MKNIIFIAPPAAGKGTQSEMLVNKYGYTHISTGDLLREKQNDGTELGNNIKEILSKGKLVNDEIVTNLLKEKLSKLNSNFILDGYPRTVKQAKILDDLLLSLNKYIDVVIYLNVDEVTALRRATGRLSCPKCGKLYNKFTKNSIKDGICDICNVKLINRSDDNEESFRNRFESYLNNTKPLISYYEQKGILSIIENNDDSKFIFKEIEKVI